MDYRNVKIKLVLCEFDSYDFEIIILIGFHLSKFGRRKSHKLHVTKCINTGLSAYAEKQENPHKYTDVIWYF